MKLKRTVTTGQRHNSTGEDIKEVAFGGTEVMPLCRAWWAEFTMGAHKTLVRLPDGKAVVVEDSDLEA